MGLTKGKSGEEKKEDNSHTLEVQSPTERKYLVANALRCGDQKDTIQAIQAIHPTAERCV
jgi:hypothetical protein